MDKKQKIQPNEYTKMLHFPLISALCQTNKKELQENKLNNTGILKEDNMTIELENYIDNKYNLMTTKILILALEKLTEKMPCKAKAEEIEKNRVIEISIEEYMERCNIASKTQAREQLKETIKTLTNDLKLSWYDQKHNFYYQHCTIFKELINMGSPIKNCVATIQFDYDFAKGLSYGYIMPLNKKILSLDIRRFPSAVPLAIKLLQHKNMNRGKTNENVISVKSLLNSTAEIPKYENLKGKSGVSKRIITPFENALEQLERVGIIDEFSFYEAKGKLISDEALERKKYDDFIKWNVHFKIDDFPRYKRKRRKKAETEGKNAGE